MNVCFLVEESVLSFSSTFSVTRKSCWSYTGVSVYMCIIYVQQKSTLNFLILVILACIKVAKLFFIIFF